MDVTSEEIEMHALPYDFDMYLSELRLRGYPDECIAYYNNKLRYEE